MRGHYLAINQSFCLQRAFLISSGIEDEKRTAAFLHDSAIKQRPFLTGLRAYQLVIAVEAYFVAIRKDGYLIRRRKELFRHIIRGNEHHRSLIQSRLGNRLVTHTLQHIITELGVAIHIHHATIHCFVLAAAGIVVVAPQEVAAHIRIGIQHTPVEVTIAI